MKKNKIFDGMTFVHSFNSIKKRTEQLKSLFEKTQYGDSEEPTDGVYWVYKLK